MIQPREAHVIQLNTSNDPGGFDYMVLYGFS